MSNTNTTLTTLTALIQADFEAEVAGTGTFDLDDPKWDAYPFDLLEQACMALGLA